MFADTHRPAKTAASKASDIALRLITTVLVVPGGFSPKWHYEDGLMAMAIDAAGRALSHPELSERALSAVAALVGPDGSMTGYRESEYNLDQVNPGRNLFRLLETQGDVRYEKALHALRGQLERQPRCPSGGFWHKKIYPNQMWLDGLYMAEPFLARYASFFKKTADFDEVVGQFLRMEKAAFDAPSGLLRHAVDESKAMPWADPNTGRSPHAWGRAVGWFAMALVDSYEYFPVGHHGLKEISSIMERILPGILKAQDPESGLWPQVMDRPIENGNYYETSASSMLSYALGKAARLGMIDSEPALKASREAFAGIVGNFLTADPDGSLHLDGTCAVAGLGGKPYRDGSFEYYIHEPRKRDDFKGLGPFILAALEFGGNA
jgi:unsaturated rhamnogalacturonyl hydrolase